MLCCDEKSQEQALERTQLGLPLGIGHIRTQTHDYIRNGTLTLFAALDYAQDQLISSLETQHRHQEWLALRNVHPIEVLQQRAPNPGRQRVLVVSGRDTRSSYEAGIRQWLRRWQRRRLATWTHLL